MKALTFKITLLDPTLVIMLGSGDANQLQSFDYIPGSVLRSTLAARYIKAKKLGTGAAQDDTCRRLFFDGKVRYLNACPANRQGQRTLPVPLSWQAEKDNLADFDHNNHQSLRVVDLAHDNDTTLDSGKPLNRPFCTLSPSGEIEFSSAKRRVMMHNARTQRRIIAEGASFLFQYEALAEGEQFVGVILADDDVDTSPLKELLKFSSLSIGKSRSAGYGRIQVSEVIEQNDWSEYNPTEDYETLADDEDVVITLLSDALVRDDAGVYTTDISHALGLPPNSFKNAFIKTQINGGFNRKWGLPLPQVPAIKMGSVFVFESSKLNLEQLETLQTNGLGERTLDGFGRIAVNWHRYDELKARKVDAHPVFSDVSLSGHAAALAKRVVDYRLRRRLDHLLLQTINNSKITSKGSKSQLSRVRLMARRSLESHSPDVVQLTPLVEFLNNITGKQAEKELQHLRINGEPLYGWLNRHAKNPAEIINTLNWQSSDQSSSLGGIKANFDAELQYEYTARLIEGVVKRKLDELRQEEG